MNQSQQRPARQGRGNQTRSFNGGRPQNTSNNRFARPDGGRSGGSSRFGGGRSSGGGNKRRGQYIHPSKFVKKAVTPKEEIPYVPTHTFADFPFSQHIQSNLAHHGFVKPSAIQDQAMMPALEGRDIIGLADTGTGKTAAFLLPIIEKLPNVGGQPSTLILTPTRELASQIEDQFTMFSRGMRLYATTCVGGVNIVKQIRSLERRPHVIIATPGRLKDLLQRRAVSLNQIKFLVLDEADRMLDMGFLKEIQAIIAQLPRERQTMCFSATITPAIKTLIDGMLNDPVTVSVRTGDTSEYVEQDVVHANDKDHKLELLTQMLAQEAFEKVLIFGETKFGVKRLAESLSKQGHPAESIHGNKTQPQRQRALDNFKQNRVKVLVATDVAARGLDIPNVSHVINFDQPMTYDDYVHRIGRTGRGGKRGTALTFIDKR